MLRCGVSRCALPLQPPCVRHARRSAPTPPRRARCIGPLHRTAHRSRVCLPALRAAADDDACDDSAAPSAPPPAAPGAPLWVVPWDAGVSASVCARFAFLWCVVGFGGQDIVQLLHGAPLSADARAEASLALELFKAAATYQLVRRGSLSSRLAAHTPLKPHVPRVQFSSRLAPFAPLPPPLFACRFGPKTVALGAAGALGAAVAARAVPAAAGSVAALLAPADAGASGAFFIELMTKRRVALHQVLLGFAEISAFSPCSDAGFLGPGPLAACAITVGVTPPVEEAFFRGFLLPVMAQAMPPAAAVVASSAVFAFVHFTTPSATVQLFAVGAVLGATLLAARGNLAAPIVAHAGYNAITLATLASYAAASQSAVL